MKCSGVAAERFAQLSQRVGVPVLGPSQQDRIASIRCRVVADEAGEHREVVVGLVLLAARRGSVHSDATCPSRSCATMKSFAAAR